MIDLMTFAGLALGIAAVYYVMARGQIQSLLLNIDAFVLVFGGTIAATLVTFPFKLLKQCPHGLWLTFFPPRTEGPGDIIRKLVYLSGKARMSGIPSLQDDAAKTNDRFLREGIQMVVDNYPPEVIRDSLEKEIMFTRKRHGQLAGVFRMMGTYSPIFGLLGTLIGVVQVLRNLQDPTAMGTSMAIAVTTTFYGIFGANFLFLPVSGKLNAHTEEEMLLKEVMIEGILSIQEGDIPLLVSKKLESYLAFRLREKELHGKPAVKSTGGVRKR